LKDERDTDNDDSPAVSFEVQQGLKYMIPSPFPGNDTHLVCSETLDGDFFFISFPKLCLEGGVGHEYVANDRKHQRQTTAEQEDDLWKASILA
jgi:hypothetical protein